MSLKIAVQMDPIERINIRGDSTFACCWRRSGAATPSPTTRPTGWRWPATEVIAAVQPLTVRDKEGDHFTLGEATRTDLSTFDVILLRQDPPFDLAYITTTHLLERIHPEDAGGERPRRPCATRRRRCT